MLVTGNVKAQGGVMVGSTSATCDAAHEGMFRWNKSNKLAEVCDGSAWTSLAPPSSDGAMYRYAIWNTYWMWGTGWFSGNDGSLYGGIAPNSWSDGNVTGANLSSSSTVLRGFLYRKGPAIGSGATNSVVVSEEWVDQGNTSSSSRHAMALFRVKNTTGSSIVWKLSFYCTAYGGWSERCSASINGSNIWNSGSSNYNGSSATTVNLTVPANRISTVVVIASSSPVQWYSRTLNLAFYNNSLKLPTGLEYVDDLDTKPDGWNN
jgi:hypothetical protein